MTRLAAVLLLLGAGIAIGPTASLAADPFVQAATLTPSSGRSGDGLGFSVAVSGDGSTVVAGAPSATVSGHAREGAVYVFVRRARGWSTTNTAELTVHGAASDLFGVSVAVSRDGSTIVVGAQGVKVAGNVAQGAAYVFRRPAAGWASISKAVELTASNGGAGDAFGTAVGISSDGAWIVAGAEAATVVNNVQQGAAYVFARPPGGWGRGSEPQHQATELTASNGGQSDFLGYSVAVSGDGATVVAGAPFAAVSSLGGQGAVYTFTRPAGGWASGGRFAQQAAELTASDGVPGDSLGVSVAVSRAGSTVASGAVGASVSGHQSQGAVYAFVRRAGGWTTSTQTAKLTAAGGAADEDLGGSVEVSGDGATIAGGALGATASGHPDQGVVHVFARPGGGWANVAERAKLTAADGSASEHLGASVALGGTGATIVAGAPSATVAGDQGQGVGYVFTRSRRASTATLISCRPPSVPIGRATRCTATVTDTSDTTATGLVRFRSGAGGSFGSGGRCRLRPGASAGLAFCELAYRLSAAARGRHRVTAAYAGDAVDLPSKAKASVTG